MKSFDNVDVVGVVFINSEDNLSPSVPNSTHHLIEEESEKDLEQLPNATLVPDTGEWTIASPVERRSPSRSPQWAFHMECVARILTRQL
jgi:hypothetical protein